jgi:gamma-glutamyl-gamma-aminobutyrate hydrolase PuuD
VTCGPLVGILCGRSPSERFSTHRGYVASLTQVGAVPVILAAGADVDHFALSTVVDHCVALVATGGGDVDVERVNSIHHQAVADPGQALRATAWSNDGVIEAVEAPGLLGVQWHPERLSGGDPRYLAPFRWLVAQ